MKIFISIIPLNYKNSLKGVGDPMLRGYFNIISGVFRGRVIWFLMLKTFNSVRLHWVFEGFYIFLGFLTKNTHCLCQNSKILCHFVTPLSQMIKLSELDQMICFSSQENQMARSYGTNTESVQNHTYQKIEGLQDSGEPYDNPKGFP